MLTQAKAARDLCAHEHADWALVNMCRRAELNQALQSLQDVTGTRDQEDAGRGVLASAGGRHLKRALRGFAEAHPGAR